MLRRVALFVPTLIGATLVVFMLLRVLPGDPALAILVGAQGNNPVVQSDLDALREYMDLDQPLPIQ